MAILTVNVDDDLKSDAERLYNSMGMDLTAAVDAFLRKSLQVGGMPFTPTSGVREVRVDPSGVLLPARSASGAPVLPADWDDGEDGVYDSLY